MLNPNPENPFFQFKARSIFIVFFIINFLIGAIAGIVINFIGLKITDPIMTYIFYCVGFIWLCLWAIQQLRQLHINPRYIVGNLPSNYQWLPIVGLVAAILLFSIGAALLFFNVLSLLAPSFVESLVKSVNAEKSALSAFPMFYKVLKIFSIVAIAPLTEEFIFRGVLLHIWASKWGIVPGILISSLIFGFLHINPIGLSVFGIIMALLYIRTRTLIVPIVAHALNNIVAVGLESVPKQNYTYDLKFSILCLAISTPVIILFIFKKWPNNSVLLPYFANASN